MFKQVLYTIKVAQIHKRDFKEVLKMAALGTL